MLSKSIKTEVNKEMQEVKNTSSSSNQKLVASNYTAPTGDTLQAATTTVNPEALSTTAKRRMRTSREEMAILEGYYKTNPNPNQQEKQKISQSVQMAEKSVHFWFQNRRAKDNKKRRILEGDRGKKNVFSIQSGDTDSTLHKGKRSTARHQQQQKQSKKSDGNSETINHNNSSPSSARDGHRSNVLYHTSAGSCSPYLIGNGMEYCHDPPPSTGISCDVYPQQQFTENRYNLPPISSIVTPQQYNSSVNTCSAAAGAGIPNISFYFHHPDFGIESCMTQWSQYHQYHHAAMEFPATRIHKEWQQHQQQPQQQH